MKLAIPLMRGKNGRTMVECFPLCFPQKVVLYSWRCLKTAISHSLNSCSVKVRAQNIVRRKRLTSRGRQRTSLGSSIRSRKELGLSPRRQTHHLKSGTRPAPVKAGPRQPRRASIGAVDNGRHSKMHDLHAEIPRFILGRFYSSHELHR